MTIDLLFIIIVTFTYNLYRLRIKSYQIINSDFILDIIFINLDRVIVFCNTSKAKLLVYHPAGRESLGWVGAFYYNLLCCKYNVDHSNCPRVQRSVG